jgi:hypothetical protein
MANQPEIEEARLRRIEKAMLLSRQSIELQQREARELKERQDIELQQREARELLDPESKQRREQEERRLQKEQYDQQCAKLTAALMKRFNSIQAERRNDNLPPQSLEEYVASERIKNAEMRKMP